MINCLASLAGVLSTFFALACAPDVNVPSLKTWTPAVVHLEKQKSLVDKTSDAADATVQKAEKVASEGTNLRQNQTEKDLHKAIALFKQGARLFKAAHRSSKAAELTLQVGEIYFTLSRYDDALNSYKEALNLDAKNPELACLVPSRMARIYATTGRESQADAYSKHALAQCKALPNPKLQAEALEARGETLWYSNDSPGSAEFFSRAQELFGKANDTSGQAHALLMLAYAHFWGQRAESVQFARSALQLSSSNKDNHGVAEARTELGIFAALTGEFETAKCNYERSITMFHSIGDKDNEAVSLNGTGYANWQTGNIDTSLESYKRAKAVFTGVRDQIGAVESITGMGKSLSAMRQYGQLLPLYTAKLRLARQTKNAVQEASALADMAGVYESQHQYAKAKKLYQEALDIYSSAKNDSGIGDTLVRLALVYARQGEDSQALDLLEKARVLKEKTGQVGDVARIHFEVANIYRRLNRLQEAITSIEKTIEVIEAQRLKIASFDSRAAYFSSVHKYYALYIQVLMLLERQGPKRDSAQSAFEASEKSKVRALLDLLSASSNDSPCDELLQRQLSPGIPVETLVAAKDELASSPVLTLKQIQAELGTDDTVLEFLLGDEKSYVWAVDSNQISVHELPPAAEIEKLVHLFRETLTARELRAGEDLHEYKERVQKADQAYPWLARQLSKRLLGSVDLARTKRLLIVPDGSLQDIPFSALLNSQSRKPVHLVRQHELVVLPSASVLGTLRKAAGKRPVPTRTAVVIADPVVDKDDPRLLHAGSSLRRKSQAPSSGKKMKARSAHAFQQIIRLEGTGTEANAIQRILGARDVLIKEGFDASRGFVIEGDLQLYRIVHFATHGFTDTRRPEMSGLVLSLRNEKGRRQNGYLRLGDIYKLKLSADLVVLSACDSAMGRELESEGMIGLPRAFLFAGSRSVLASLWKVDDEAAAVFMTHFYTRIQNQERPSSALRGAQLDMLKEKDWSEPFYWAAFVLQGDYK